MSSALESDPIFTSTTGGRGEEILLAAIRCFDRWGVERTRMDDIAKEAQVPRPALYKYYDSKEALVIAAVVRHIDYRALRLHKSTPAAGPAGPALLAALMNGILERTGRRMLLEGATERTVVLAYQSPEVLRSMHNFWHPYLVNALERGELRAGLEDDDFDRTSRWLTAVALYYLALPGIAFGAEELPTYLEIFVVGSIIPGQSKVETVATRGRSASSKKSSSSSKPRT